MHCKHIVECSLKLKENCQIHYLCRESGAATTESENAQLSDEMKKLPTVRGMHKVAGVDVFSSRSGTVRVAVLHTNNSLALYPTTLTATTKTQAQDGSGQPVRYLVIFLL